jgi:hypothetical protein
MKKITIITALVLGSFSSFAQGSVTCGEATFNYGALVPVDKFPAKETEYVFEHTYYEKTDSYITFYEFKIDKTTKDTAFAYSYKVNLLSLVNVRSEMKTKENGSNPNKSFSLELMDLSFSKKHIESNKFECISKENIKRGENMIVWEFSTAAKRDEIMGFLKPFVNSEYR